MPQTEAVATVDSEGYKITAVLVGEGDVVTAGQALAQLSRAAIGNAAATTATLKSPVAGLVIRRATMVGIYRVAAGRAAVPDHGRRQDRS